MNRRALQICGTVSLAWALGGGLARMLVLLAVWFLAARAGLPAAASAVDMIVMYTLMMVAGLAGAASSNER